MSVDLSHNSFSPVLDNSYSIDFKQVSVSLNEQLILDTITCTLTEPRIAVFGNNGSGKSTFARCASGVPSIQEKSTIKGDIVIHGIAISKLKKSIWKYVNMTFQIPDQQIIMPNVREELEIGLKNLGHDKQTIKEKVEYGLDVLKLHPEQACHSLSVGKKRLLCLMSILLVEPKTIILDEPTTFLDMPTKIQFMNFLETLPIQIIFITHDFSLVESYNTALCFHKGKIHCEGSPQEVLKRYQELW